MDTDMSWLRCTACRLHTELGGGGGGKRIFVTAWSASLALRDPLKNCSVNRDWRVFRETWSAKILDSESWLAIQFCSIMWLTKSTTFSPCQPVCQHIYFFCRLQYFDFSWMISPPFSPLSLQIYFICVVVTYFKFLRNQSRDYPNLIT